MGLDQLTPRPAARTMRALTAGEKKAQLKPVGRVLRTPAPTAQRRAGAAKSISEEITGRKGESNTQGLQIYAPVDKDGLHVRFWYSKNESGAKRQKPQENVTKPSEFTS